MFLPPFWFHLSGFYQFLDRERGHVLAKRPCKTDNVQPREDEAITVFTGMFRSDGNTLPSTSGIIFTVSFQLPFGLNVVTCLFENTAFNWR